MEDRIASQRWMKIVKSVTEFPRDLLLVWDCAKTPSENGEDDKYSMSSQIFEDARSMKIMEQGLIFSDLRDYGRAAEMFKRAIENCEGEVEGDYSHTIAAVTYLAEAYKSSGFYMKEKRCKMMADILSRDQDAERMVVDLLVSHDEELIKFSLTGGGTRALLPRRLSKLQAQQTGRI